MKYIYSNIADPFVVQCPVHGSLDPAPFKHFGIEGSVPRKCLHCPFLFEGECSWVQEGNCQKPFAIRISNGKGSGENALRVAYEKALSNFLLSSRATRLFLNIEGDLSTLWLSEIAEIISLFEGIIPLDVEGLFSVGPHNELADGIEVSLIQAIEQSDSDASPDNLR